MKRKAQDDFRVRDEAKYTPAAANDVSCKLVMPEDARKARREFILARFQDIALPKQQSDRKRSARTAKVDPPGARARLPSAGSARRQCRHTLLPKADEKSIRQMAPTKGQNRRAAQAGAADSARARS